MTKKAWAVALIAMMLALACQTSAAREPKRDPQTRRVRVLYVGDTVWRTWQDITADPVFSVVPVPATLGYFSGDALLKFMRQYIPHTYQTFVGTVDLLVLSDTDRSLFTSQQESWFRDGVVERGQGLVMAGGFEAFGGYAYGRSWKGSAVEEALSAECLDYSAWDARPFFARPAEGARGHPFVASLPWGGMPAFDGMNIVAPKQSSTVLLRSVPTALGDPEYPVLIYWEVGDGAAVAHTPDWNPGWGATVMNYWEYYQDYIVNIAYLASGLDVPQELQLVHSARTELATHALQKSTILSVLEFAESFGGNIASLEKRLYEIEPMKEEAEELYLDQAYDSVLEKMAQVREKLSALSSDAVKLKDQTMLWVYLAEWLVVSVTSLLCGVALWTLMVKRRVYREVRATRLGR